MSSHVYSVADELIEGWGLGSGDGEGASEDPTDIEGHNGVIFRLDESDDGYNSSALVINIVDV